MDHLKLYAKNENDLQSLLSTIKRCSDYIGMQFGLDKCAKVKFKKDLLVKSKNITLYINTEIRELEKNKTNKYLGINEANGINHTIIKEKLRNEFYRRIRAILKPELNAKNKVIAINTLAMVTSQRMK